MPDARFLIRLQNTDGETPELHSILLTRLRRLSDPLGGRVLNLRITPRAFEFDLFGAADIDREPFTEAWRAIGTLLTWRRLDVEEPPERDPDVLLAQARALFDEARFWEVHEVLEILWKAASGEEKRLMQGLILIAAAFVHHQRAEPGIVWRMLIDGLERLQNQPALYHGWPVARLREAVQDLLHRREIRPILL